MLAPSPSEWSDGAYAEFGRWHRHERFRMAMLGANGKVPSDFDENGQPIPLEDWNGAHDHVYLGRAARAGANLALRTGDFPVVVIGCSSPRIADAVVSAIAAELRVPVPALSMIWCEGSRPRCAILFALKSGAAPFKGGNAAVAIDANGEKQVVKILADGQRAAVAGVDTAGARFQIRGPHPADVGPEGMVMSQWHGGS
jgi:hypothetical protein